MARWVLLVSLIASSASLSGCDRDKLVTYPVRGKLLFDGKPVAYATIAFHPLEPNEGKPIRPVATVDADGSFTLSTYGKNDGAPAGEYIVTVEWRRAEKTQGGDYQPGPNRLPARYGKQETSHLRAMVEPGPNDLPIFHLKK